MHDVANYIVNYLQTNWSSIGIYLLSGAAVSAVAEVWIRFRKHDKTLWKEVTVGTITVLGTTSDWIIQNYATSPLAALGNIGPRLFVAAVVTHRILVNPLVKQLPKLVSDNPLTSVLRDARAYRATQATQPTEPTEVPFN